MYGNVGSQRRNERSSHRLVLAKPIAASFSGRKFQSCQEFINRRTIPNIPKIFIGGASSENFNLSLRMENMIRCHVTHADPTFITFWGGFVDSLEGWCTDKSLKKDKLLFGDSLN